MTDLREGDGETLYGVAEIAKFLGIPEKACRQRVERRDIPTFKIGRKRCGRRSTLRAWLDSLETAAAGPGR